MNLALAGAGTVSVLHAMAASAEQIPIVAVASRTPSIATERAEQVNGRAVSFADLPAGADAVIVCTPVDTHAQFVLAALKAGAAVLVEKPMASTLTDADEIVAATARGGRLLYGENLAHSPVVVRALELSREIGQLNFVELRMLAPHPTWGEFLNPQRGGGALFDLGAHSLALALLLAGDDQLVSVIGSLQSSPGIEVDDYAEVILLFRSGLQGRIEVSWRHPDTFWDMQASSDTGVVRAELLPLASIEHNGEPVALPNFPEGVVAPLTHLGFIEQLRDLQTVVDGNTPQMDATFGRYVLEIICAAYASAGNGQTPVTLPFTGLRDRTPHQLWHS